MSYYPINVRTVCVCCVSFFFVCISVYLSIHAVFIQNCQHFAWTRSLIDLFPSLFFNKYFFSLDSIQLHCICSKAKQTTDYHTIYSDCPLAAIRILSASYTQFRVFFFPSSFFLFVFNSISKRIPIERAHNSKLQHADELNERPKKRDFLTCFLFIALSSFTCKKGADDQLS